MCLYRSSHKTRSDPFFYWKVLEMWSNIIRWGAWVCSCGGPYSSGQPCLFKYSNSIKIPFTFLVLKENVQMDEFYGPGQYMIGGRVQKHLFMVILIICKRNETWKENRVVHIFLIGFPILPPPLALTLWPQSGRQTTWSNIAQHDNKHVLAIVALSLIHIWRCRRRG